MVGECAKMLSPLYKTLGVRRRRGLVNHSECLNCRRMKESLTDSAGKEAVLKLGKLKQGH